jgi:hypothetical protein
MDKHFSNVLGDDYQLYGRINHEKD